MTADQRLTLILGFISVVGIPTLTFAFRAMIKWTRVQSTLENLVSDVKELIENKEKVHAMMFQTMKDDRSATDKRLRWLEENLWWKGRSPHG